MDGALDEALGLELAEAAREQPVGEPGNRLSELGEEVGALGEDPDDRPRPASANQLDRGVKVGTDVCGASVPRGLEVRPRLHPNQVTEATTPPREAEGIP